MSEEQPRLTGWNPDGRPRLRGAFPQPAYRELGLGKLGEIGFAPALTSARDQQPHDGLGHEHERGTGGVDELVVE